MFKDASINVIKIVSEFGRSPLEGKNSKEEES